MSTMSRESEEEKDKKIRDFKMSVSRLARRRVERRLHESLKLIQNDKLLMELAFGRNDKDMMNDNGTIHDVVWQNWKMFCYPKEFLNPYPIQTNLHVLFKEMVDKEEWDVIKGRPFDLEHSDKKKGWWKRLMQTIKIKINEY